MRCKPSKYFKSKHPSLIKIQIGGVFWFKDNLCLVNKKKHTQMMPTMTKDYEQQKIWMSTKNDKTTTNNIQVSKRHVENAKGISLDMIFFLFGK
jgi:hypothetical protein